MVNDVDNVTKMPVVIRQRYVYQQNGLLVTDLSIKCVTLKCR
jgi:hypothetical protein